MYCPNCGSSVEEGSTFCSNCGAPIRGSPAATGAPQAEKPAPTPKAKPRIGYILTVIGGALTFLSGIGYLVVGNPVAGVLGIIFGFLIIYYGRRLYAAADMRKIGIYGAIPFLLGWFILIASGTLLPFDIGVSLAGFLTVVGSVSLFAGR